MLGGNTVCSFFLTISPAMEKMEKVVIVLILLQSEYFMFIKLCLLVINLHSLYFFYTFEETDMFTLGFSDFVLMIVLNTY